MSLGGTLSTNPDASYFMAITYLMLTLFALRKLYQVRSASGVWDTTSFFVGSVLFACLVRTFAFASLCALALKDVTISTESSITTNNVNIFYGKVIEVLLNIGDFVSVSTYLALVVVWVETFQHSRRHYYSERASHRSWMVTYLIINGALYALQLILYLAYFFWAHSKSFLDVIYIVLATIDLLVPIALFACWILLHCVYSGFPFKSLADEAKWTKMSRMTMLWSICRALSATGSILMAIGVLAGDDDDGRWTPMILVTLFLVTEVAPFLLALSSDLLTLLAYDNNFLYRRQPAWRSPGGGGGGGLGGSGAGESSVREARL